MRRPRSAACALVTGSTILAATHAQLLMLVLAGVLLLVCLGVVLPAVWFGDAHRRRDARAVLQQLLNLVRHPRSP
jgi:Flp pilus assembly protein TadB